MGNRSILFFLLAFSLQATLTDVSAERTHSFMAGSPLRKSVDTDKGVYVVALQEVVRLSETGKLAMIEVKAIADSGKKEISRLKVGLQRAQSNLKSQASVLSAEALKTKKAEVREKQRALEDTYKEKQSVLEEKNQSAMQSLLEKIDMVIKELAQEGYPKFILQKDPRFTVYSNPSLDLTGEVIRRLDKKYADIVRSE